MAYIIKSVIMSSNRIHKYGLELSNNKWVIQELYI